jgi:GPI-anchor transamidase subunit GAA1
MAQPATLGGPSSRSTFSLPTSLPNPTRLRTYVLRLPLFTRLTILLILLAYILSLQSTFSITTWGSLKPSVIGIFSGGMYRLNTYPFIHRGFWHMLFNLVALVPLFERFEKECGTLTSAALWLGPLATLPGGLYIGIERGIWGGDDEVLGASVWVFLLLAVEAIRSWRGNPFFECVRSLRLNGWTFADKYAVLRV